MQLVKRSIRRRSGQHVQSAFYLIDGDYRSTAYTTVVELVSQTHIEMFFNPNFLSPANSNVTFEILVDEPILNHSIFLSKYPEFFL